MDKTGMAYKIQETPFVQTTTWPLNPSRSMVKEALYSFSLEKSDGDHKSGQYIKAVERILTYFQFSLV